MCLKFSYNKLIVFALGMAIGLWSAIFFHSSNKENEIKSKDATQEIKDRLIKQETDLFEKKLNEIGCNGTESEQKLYKEISRKSLSKGEGGGIGSGSGEGSEKLKLKLNHIVKKDSKNVGVMILSKPRPEYTCKARINNTQGKVMLKITFLANGEIGGVSLLDGLPNGLNEQAIQAARKIKFEPANINGKNYTVTKRIQYNFTIY
jgi:TonB family protein